MDHDVRTASEYFSDGAALRDELVSGACDRYGGEWHDRIRSHQIAKGRQPSRTTMAVGSGLEQLKQSLRGNLPGRGGRAHEDDAARRTRIGMECFLRRK